LIAVDCLRTITDIVGSQREPSEYPCIAWYYHCSYLLSHANSEKHLHLYEKVKDQMAAINLDWLKQWMVEAIVNAGKSYIISGLKLGKVSVIVLCLFYCTNCSGSATRSQDTGHQVSQDRNSLECKAIYTAGEPLTRLVSLIDQDVS